MEKGLKILKELALEYFIVIICFPIFKIASVITSFNMSNLYIISAGLLGIYFSSRIWLIIKKSKS